MTATHTQPSTYSQQFTSQSGTQKSQILVFHCLFTTDVTRKAKRWKDGYLNYHAFNRRVMVYDTTRNHVGNTYLRDSTQVTISEGDELKLDRGVLVEVGEAAGGLEQDVSQVIKQRTPNKDATSGQGLRRKLPTPVLRREFPSQYDSVIGTAGTGSVGRRDEGIRSLQAISGDNSTNEEFGGRPKTLSAILGTQRGRIGRASVPVGSPFERRQRADAIARTSTAHTGNVASRDDTNAGDEHIQRPAKRRKTMKLHDEPEIREQLPARQATRKPARQKAPKQAEPQYKSAAIVIESDESDGPIVSSPVQVNVVSLQQGPPPITTAATLAKPKAAKKPEKPSTSKTKKTKTNITARHERETPNETRSPLKERPINPLRSSNAKPRRKLMYRALLQGQLKPASLSTIGDENDSPVAIESLKMAPEAASMDTENTDIAIPSDPEPVPDETHVPEEDEAIPPPVSPLPALSNNNDDSPAATSNPAFPPILLSDFDAEPPHKKPSESIVNQESPSTLDLLVQDSNLVFAAQTAHLAAQTPTSATKRQSSRSPLQRSVTEANLLATRSAQTSPTKRLFQRSNTVANRADVQQHQQEIVEKRKDDAEKGPWTREEAWDLFGWKVGEPRSRSEREKVVVATVI